MAAKKKPTRVLPVSPLPAAAPRAADLTEAQLEARVHALPDRRREPEDEVSIEELAEVLALPWSKTEPAEEPRAARIVRRRAPLAAMTRRRAAEPGEAKGWFSVSAGNWKAHAAPAALVEPLVAEMTARGAEGEITRKPVEKWGIDRGGMCYADRPTEVFKLGGLGLWMPSEHVAHFRARLEELELRRFGRRSYYKLHCHWSCLLLPPALRRRLLEAMKRREPAAAKRADAFYKEKARGPAPGGGAP